jgi:N-acetyltransferase
MTIWKPTLTGSLVHLRALREDDWPALHAAASDPLIWEQHPEPTRWQASVFRKFFDGALAADGGLIVLDARTGAAIGSSRYHAHDAARREVEIGWTFLTRAYWGGAANREMKALMLRHAFAHVDRVIFRVGPNNLRSQKALGKIGAQRVGPMQDAHDASGRQSVVFELRKENFGL